MIKNIEKTIMFDSQITKYLAINIIIKNLFIDYFYRYSSVNEHNEKDELMFNIFFLLFE